MFSQEEYQRFFDGIAAVAVIEDYLLVRRYPLRGHRSRRDQELVDMYYETKPVPTLQEVAERFGITRQRVSQILNLHASGTHPSRAKGHRFTKREVRRFFYAVKRAAQLEERWLEHGTLRRYRGGSSSFGFKPCRCEACTKANRDHTYKMTGYTPKYGQAEYYRMQKELGRVLDAGETIEQALEQKRRNTDGSQ